MRKKTRFRFLLICIIVFALVSCQKEKSVEMANSTGGTNGGGGSTNGTEVGNWKFISMYANTSQTVEFIMGGEAVKAISLSNYTTENNGGTVKFDGSNMTSSGLTYSLNTIEKTYIYYDGVLDDSVEIPYSASLPPTNQTAGYKKIGTDSLYFQSGVFTQLSSGGTTQSIPVGYKLKFDGDKMTMTMPYNEVKTEVNQGITEKVTTHAVTVTTLQKQ